jgi:hypothetical protein
MKIDRVMLWCGGGLISLFLFSMALYLLLPGNLTRVILTFPQEITRQQEKEVRFLPFGWDGEHNMLLLVREVLLGPARNVHLRLFSRKAEVNTVLERDGTIYVDLAKSSFIPDPDVLYSPQMSLDVLEKTLLDNFNNLKSVKFFVDGHAPFEKSR